MGIGPGTVHPAASGNDLTAPAKGGNYRPTAADRVGEGSLKEKYRQNVEAIRCLRQIEAERRPATPAEQSILIRYVG